MTGCKGVQRPPRRRLITSTLPASTCSTACDVQGGHELNAFLEVVEIRPAPVAAEHLEAARLAWRRLGKGRHPATLNFGDRFARVLAQVTAEPLLYKGNKLCPH